MVHIINQVIDRIKHIRLLKQRSINDCAIFLNISEEQYLKFEEGITPLTLPDIELLAIYFRIPLQTFFNNEPIKDYSIFLLSNEIHPKFIKLRHKMIHAKYAIAKEKRGLTIDDIHQATQIPMEVLHAYDKGDSSIPFDHLLLMSDALATPLEEFFNQESALSEDIDNYYHQRNWRPEYPKEEIKADELEEDPYMHLISALKRIPHEEQAHIAKIIIDKLKDN